MDNIKQQIEQIISRINEKNPYYSIIGFLVIVFLLDYFLVMQFQLKMLNSLNTKLMTLSTDLEKSEVDIQRFSAYQNQLNKLKNNFEKLDQKIKGKEDLPLIMENISRLANKHGIRIEQIMPNTAQSKSVLKNIDGEYHSIPISVQAKGEYHDFGRFINQLENEEVFMLIPEFSIVGGQGRASNQSIKMKIQAIVFEKTKG